MNVNFTSGENYQHFAWTVSLYRNYEFTERLHQFFAEDGRGNHYMQVDKVHNDKDYYYYYYPELYLSLNEIMPLHIFAFFFFYFFLKIWALDSVIWAVKLSIYNHTYPNGFMAEGYF